LQRIPQINGDIFSNVFSFEKVPKQVFY